MPSLVSERKPNKVFTPERITQIKNLIEQGKTRAQVAELIGTSVASLAVTCSRLGISLRPYGRDLTRYLGNGKLKLLSQIENDLSITLTIHYKGREQTVDLPISRELFGQIAIEASMKNVTAGEMIVKLIQHALENDAPR